MTGVLKSPVGWPRAWRHKWLAGHGSGLLGGEPGVSIIIALTVIIFMLGFVADLMVTSQVSHRMSINLQAQAQAEYLASSGQKLATFLLTIDQGIDLKMAEMAQITPVDSPADVWGMLGGIPIGGEDDSMLKLIISMFGLSEAMDASLLQELKSLQGSFRFEVEDESARLNLSYLQSSQMGEQVIGALERLLSCPTEQVFMADKNVVPTELAYTIFDFIDINKKARLKSGYTTENSPYEGLDQPYKVVNRPLVSVAQLRLVAGWDPQIHSVFRPLVTVFPAPNKYSKLSLIELGKQAFLNINSVSRQLMQCLFPDMTPDCYDEFVLQHTRAVEQKLPLARDTSAMAQTLRDLVCYEPDSSLPNLVGWFRTTSPTYRIRSQGVVGDTIYTKTVVIERLTPEYMKEHSRTSAWDMLYFKHGSS